jgi:hypothetical protein
MTGRRTVRAGPVLLAALVALVAGGCGVRPSGVITGGPAVSGPAEGVRLYLVSNGDLAMVLRATRQQPSPTETLTLLVRGPDDAERAQGLTTEIPREFAPVEVTSRASGVTVQLPGDVAALSATAVDQIVCTVQSAMATGGLPAGTTVTLLGSGASHRVDACPHSDAGPPRGRLHPPRPAPGFRAP